VRRALPLLVLLASLVAASAAFGAKGSSLSVTPVARLKFPERGFLVGLPRNTHLTASDVVVHENGLLVKNPSFVPAQQSSEKFAAMLVIDTSDSMRGGPLQAAFRAARAFVDRLGSGQQVGVLTFNRKWTLLQAPTSDRAKLASVLTTPPATAGGTHIYDALAQALSALRDAHVTASSIVLLSDGADTGSATKETQLATRAQRSRVRIFTVGLHSGSFKPGPLRLLARDTHGTFTSATTAGQLGAVYESIAQKLASEYLLRYQSQATAGANVVVAVNVRGFGDSSFAYSVPKEAVAAPFHRSVLVRFWSSTLSLVVIALLVACLAAAAVLMLSRAPDGKIRARIAEFTTLRATPEEPEDDARAFSSRLFGGTERSLARTKWWARFREELELANIKYTAEQLLGLAIVGTVLLGLILYLVSPVFCIFALFVPMIVYSICQRTLKRVRRQFEDQLPDNLQVLASALRAGHSFVGALSVVATDAAEPSRREFTRVVADEQLGVPLEDSLREVARRMDNRDLEQVALVAELQRQSGGNLAEVLDRVIETIRARFDLRRLVRTLTAQGRMARWVLTFLPVGLAALISFVNPSYMAPLFNRTGGQVALVLAGLMIIAGSYIIKRIVDIKV
jgi:tight adherence protein B